MCTCRLITHILPSNDKSKPSVCTHIWAIYIELLGVSKTSMPDVTRLNQAEHDFIVYNRGMNGSEILKGKMQLFSKCCAIFLKSSIQESSRREESHECKCMSFRGTLFPPYKTVQVDFGRSRLVKILFTRVTYSFTQLH